MLSCGLAAVNCSFKAGDANFGVCLIFLAAFGEHALNALFGQFAIADELACELFVCVVGGRKLCAGDSVEDCHIRFVFGACCRVAFGNAEDCHITGACKSKKLKILIFFSELEN